MENLRHYLSTYLEGLRKPTKSLTRNSRVSQETFEQGTSQKRYCLRVCVCVCVCVATLPYSAALDEAIHAAGPS